MTKERTFTQEEVSAIAARAEDKGRRQERRAVETQLGMTIQQALDELVAGRLKAEGVPEHQAEVLGKLRERWKD